MIFKRLFAKVTPPSGQDTPTVVPVAAAQPSATATTDVPVAIWCTIAAEDAQLAAVMAEVAVLTDRAVLAQLARTALAPALRRAALERLRDDPALLAVCAVEDPLAANRLYAVECLEDRAALERVIKRIGKRDTKVYRLAREKLRLLARRAARPQEVRARCAELCASVEQLGRYGRWTLDRAKLEHLEREWQTLAAEADPADQARFDALRAAFLAAYAAHTREADAAAVAAEAAPLTSAADAAETSAAVALAPPAEERGAAPSAALKDAAYAARLHAALEHALTQVGMLDPALVRKLRQRCARLDAALPETAACAALLTKLERRYERQRAHALRKLQAAPARLEQLAEHLHSGALRKAEPLHQKLVATIEQARALALPRAEFAAIEQRLRQLAPELRELQRWRRWSADQHREALCQEAEALLASDTALEILATRLLELQRAWRQFDRSGAPAGEALWQRFRQATAALAARCQPFFEQRKLQRARDLQARTAWCERLEQFNAAAETTPIDWKQAVRLEREARQVWSTLGPVGERARQALEGRFRRALEQLARRIEEERSHNLQRKRELIEQMKALVEWPEIEQAIATAKTLQQQWQTTVAGRRREENALWQAFREASDAVFARRNAQRPPRDGASMQAAREALCQEAEALLKRDVSPAALSEAWRTLERQWRDSSVRSGARAQALEQRWRTVEQALQARIRALRVAEEERCLARLAARAAFCDQVAQGQVCTADLHTEWAALEAPETAAEREALETRWQRLCALLERNEHAQLAEWLEENRRQREMLCLRLEIAAGVDSPPEWTAQRMALQVARLQDKMSSGEGTTPSIYALLQAWYLCTPAAPDTALTARLARIMAHWRTL